MKNLFLVFAALIFTFSLSAQEGNTERYTYEKGQSLISLGLGFPNTYHTGVDIGTNLLGLNADNGSSSPQFIFNYEYGATENIAIGLYTSYFTSDSQILSAANLVGGLFGGNGLGESEYSVVSFGGKLAVRKPLIQGLDTYATTYLGYNIVNDDININVGNGGSIDLGPFGEVTAADVLNTVVSEVNYPSFTYEINAGGRYFFNDDFAFYAEAGIGRYLVNAGFSYKLN